VTTHWIKQNWHRLLAHAAGLAPAALFALDYLRDDVGPLLNRDLTLRSGSAGLLMLVASLACTPLNRLLGWRQAVQMRRPLGLYGFFYVVLHLLAYAALDNMLDFELVWRDVGERRSMVVGFAAFLALLPLALTSTRGWQQRLGRGWRALHRLVYLALPLSVLHYLWLDRDFIGVPLIYAAVVGVLLLLRLPPLRRAIVRLRARRSGSDRDTPMPEGREPSIEN
jgi:methionine sulfoxide reductase heme-binding subunit